MAELEFRRGTGPDALPFGAATDANELMELVEDPAEDDEDLFEPATEEEQFVFGPTERPDEPITAGAPFGPGPDTVQFAFESEGAFMRRVAEQIRSTGATSEAQRFAERVTRGL